MTETESGRARVRRVLIDPLKDKGMVRHPRMKTEVYGAMMERLAVRLAYLSEDQLVGLAETCIRMARGKAGNVWPEEVSILKWAWMRQPPPTSLSDYAASIMRSEMGRRARALGYHVELFHLAQRVGPPPGKYQLSKLNEQGDVNRRKIARITDQVERGVRPMEEDRQWLDWYLQKEAECLAIMNARVEDSEGAAA